MRSKVAAVKWCRLLSCISWLIPFSTNRVTLCCLIIVHVPFEKRLSSKMHLMGNKIEDSKLNRKDMHKHHKIQTYKIQDKDTHKSRYLFKIGKKINTQKIVSVLERQTQNTSLERIETVMGKQNKRHHTTEHSTKTKINKLKRMEYNVGSLEMNHMVFQNFSQCNK